MFGFSTADWIFIGFILVVIYVCVLVSALVHNNKGCDS
jgi:hypothetical protein